MLGVTVGFVVVILVNLFKSQPKANTKTHPSMINPNAIALRIMPAVFFPLFLAQIPRIKPTIEVIKPTHGITKLTIPNTNDAVPFPSPVFSGVVTVTFVWIYEFWLYVNLTSFNSSFFSSF